MKARNQSSSPVSRTMMCCPVSGPVQMLEYDNSKLKVKAPNNSIFKSGAKNEFERLVNQVGDMDYGQQITVSHGYLSSLVSGYFHKNKWYNPAERVLNNIMGSSFEYTYETNDMRGTVTFFRRERNIERQLSKYVVIGGHELETPIERARKIISAEGERRAINSVLK